MDNLKEPYRGLASAILLRAIKDLKCADDCLSVDSLYWLLLSPQVRFLLKSLNIDSNPKDLVFGDTSLITMSPFLCYNVGKIFEYKFPEHVHFNSNFKIKVKKESADDTCNCLRCLVIYKTEENTQ